MRPALVAALLSVAAFACGAERAAVEAARSPLDPRFTVVRVDTRHARLALFLDDDAGRVFHRFGRLSTYLAARGRRLVFAMNAGMFHPDWRPVGLHVADGRERHPIDRTSAPGTGNFHLQPNGVFVVDAAGPRIVETSAWRRTDVRDVTLATQSGPLLVQDGELARAVRAPSASVHTRNGVCVDGPHAVFVMADEPVSLHDFAVFLRDALHCRDALYLDGAISSLYAPSIGRDDEDVDLGPIVAVVEDLADVAPPRRP